MSLGFMKPGWRPSTAGMKRLKTSHPGLWAYLTQAGPLLILGFVAAAVIARNT